MKLQDLMPILQSVAPLHLAESWDNVGLLAGDLQQNITHAMLAIDYTAPVAVETRAAGCQLVIAYHPPIFDAIKRLTAPDPLFSAIRDNIAIYSPHTALDVADGGTNDVLADVLGLQNRRPLKPAPLLPWHYKLITFVPTAHLESLCQALFDAGAGCIGNYSHCSYRSDGIGTFFGHEGTHPAVGRPGRLEFAPESRLEVIVPSTQLQAVVAALKSNHPYEEPAFDIVQLTSPPDNKGMGRIGTLPDVRRADLIACIKAALGLGHVLVAGPTDGVVRSAACCAGACGSLINDAIAQRAGLLLTGELRHHDALKAVAGGMTVVCALHSNSERLTLHRVAQRLAGLAPQVAFVVSQADRDPFIIL